MAADYFSKRKKKVLLVDLDQQSSATLFLKLNHKFEPEMPFFQSILNGNLNTSLCHVTENLDIIPGDVGMTRFDEFAFKLSAKDRFNVLKNLLKPFEDKYDYIILDVPPSRGPIVSNAVLTTDYVVLVVQAQRASYEMFLRSIGYLNELKQEYGSKHILIGIALYLVSKGSVTEKKISKEIREQFNGVLDHQIYYSERLKTWSNIGITHSNNINDKHTHKMYDDFFEEIVKRIEA